jgi:hypothetical protein
VMPLGQQQQKLWEVILTWALFLARLPVAMCVIATTGLVSWLGVMFFFRLTQYLYTHFLDEPW